MTSSGSNRMSRLAVLSHFDRQPEIVAADVLIGGIIIVYFMVLLYVLCLCQCYRKPLANASMGQRIFNPARLHEKLGCKGILHLGLWFLVLICLTWIVIARSIWRNQMILTEDKHMIEKAGWIN